MKHNIDKNDVDIYIKTDAQYCPYCDSKDLIVVKGFTMAGPHGHLTIMCNQCLGRWNEWYDLIDITIKQRPQREDYEAENANLKEALVEGN